MIPLPPTHQQDQLDTVVLPQPAINPYIGFDPVAPYKAYLSAGTFVQRNGLLEPLDNERTSLHCKPNAPPCA